MRLDCQLICHDACVDVAAKVECPKASSGRTPPPLQLLPEEGSSSPTMASGLASASATTSHLRTSARRLQNRSLSSAHQILAAEKAKNDLELRSISAIDLRSTPRTPTKLNFSSEPPSPLTKPPRAEQKLSDEAARKDKKRDCTLL